MRKAAILTQMILLAVALRSIGNPAPALAGPAAQPKTAAATTAPAASKTPKTSEEWKLPVPKELSDPQTLVALMSALRENELFFGAVATAKRGILYFDDLRVKQEAYTTLIDALDSGLNDDLTETFLLGDLTPPAGEEFANSYYFYKGLTNQTFGTLTWAEDFFSRITRDKSPKYLLMKSIQAYKKHDLTDAEALVRKAIAAGEGRASLSLMKKLLRTLARIQFDKEDYQESLEIYVRFLLRVQPITPSDWLEAAWNLFYMRRPKETLGMLYNLEGTGTGSRIYLDSYLLRSLVYRENCALGNIEKLNARLNQDLGDALRAIKTGEALSKIPKLFLVYSSEGHPYLRLMGLYGGLKAEYSRLSSLPSDLRPLARMIYQTERLFLERPLALARQKFLEGSAQAMVMTSEMMEFAKYDTALEQSKPDKLLLETLNWKKSGGKEKNEKQDSGMNDFTFEVRWLQNGPMWRDERLKYRGKLANQCATE